MKKEWADKLVCALRSGEFKQGNGQLYVAEENAFCCLGVLHFLVNGEKSKGTDLPPTVMRECGMETSYGCLLDPVKNRETNLSVLNDTGKTFPEIADIIEENWERL